MLYSDGFELAFPQPAEGDTAAQIDVKRFEDEFRAMGQASMKQVGDYLASRLDSQAGSLNQRDDLTVLVLDVLPSAVAHAREAELASLPGD
jgi:serine phosphatase RsbU (regulator of sigma subunit)